MRDLICDVINYCASSIDMGKINVYFEITIINLTADKRRKSKKRFYINFRLKAGAGLEFIAC